MLALLRKACRVLVSSPYCVRLAFVLVSSPYCRKACRVLVGSPYCRKACLGIGGLALLRKACWILVGSPYCVRLALNLVLLCKTWYMIEGKPLLKQRFSPQTPFPKNFMYFGQSSCAMAFLPASYAAKFCSSTFGLAPKLSVNASR